MPPEYTTEEPTTSGEQRPSKSLDAERETTLKKKGPELLKRIVIDEVVISYLISHDVIREDQHEQLEVGYRLLLGGRFPPNTGVNVTEF